MEFEHNPNIQVISLEVFIKRERDQRWEDERAQDTQKSLIKVEELKEI
jgi:hypothetical protein